MSYDATTLRNRLRQARYKLGRDAKPIDLLAHVDRALNKHGVEFLHDRTCQTVAAYVNMGETYARTVLYDFGVGAFNYESVGDFVERKERARPSDGGYRFN